MLVKKLQECKKLFTTISILLVCAICLQIVPDGAVLLPVVSAEETLDPTAYITDEPQQEPSPIVTEEASRREESVKHFRLENGTFIAAEYPVAVHYEQDGELADIDNTLVYDSQTDTYAPASSPIDVRFAANTQEKSAEEGSVSTFSIEEEAPAVQTTAGLVTYESEGHTLTGALVLEEEEGPTGQQAPLMLMDEGETASEEQGVSLTVSNTQTQELEGDDAFLVLDKLTSAAYYTGILPGVDFEYIVLPDGVKENIILNTAAAQRTFRFSYNIGSLTAVQENAQTIVLKDSENQEIYRISAPLMNDANNETSSALTFTIISSENGTLIAELSADSTWLDAEGRAYPVTLDPYTQTKPDASLMKNATAREQKASGYPSGSLYVGRDSTYEKTRSYLQFDLPALNAGDMVVDCKLSLYQSAGAFSRSSTARTNVQVNVSAITAQWDETTVRNSENFVNTPAYSSTVEDYVFASASTNSSFHSLDITGLAKGWYNGEENYGVALWSQYPADVARVWFCSENSGTSVVRPTLAITYLNSRGLESRWTTHAQNGGSAGTGYVNDYTGNLVFIAPLVSTTGANMPVSLQMVYNGCQAMDVAYGYTKAGKGWRLNITQRIDTIASGTNLYMYGYRYIYTDSDGTQHYFTTVSGKTDEYADEEGMNLTIKTSTANRLILESEDGSKLEFTTAGLLLKVYDTQGRSQTLSYNGSVLQGIYDGSGRYVSITTDSNGTITKLADPAGRETKVTYDTAGFITRITYPDGTYSTFTHYSDGGKMARVISSDNSRLLYEYQSGTDASVKNRVAKVTQFDNSGSETEAHRGTFLQFAYGSDNTTTFTDNNGRSETYQFDNIGRTVSVTDALGGGSYYKYTGTGEPQNRLSAASITSKPVDNRLENHNTESGLTGWTVYGYGTTASNTEQAYIGNRSIKCTNADSSQPTSGAYQVMSSLTAGKTVTMSAYVRTSSVTALNDTGGVKVILSFYNSANTQLASYASIPVTGTNGWERIMISGAVPSGTSYARAYISLQNAAGSAWFDCAQLEEGDGANLYNLLQNSSFTDGSTGWSGSNLNTAYDKVYSESGKMTYRLLGGAEVHKNIYQTVYINRPAKESALNVSGKVQADSVAIKGERQCSLLVKYTFTDATVESKLVKFNPDTSGDQFVNQAVYPGEVNKDKTVSHVTFYALYYDNMNSAFFNDLQLTLDETGTTYTYDDKGNMISAVDNGQRNENYSYNNASELTSATNPDNTNYTYKYADNNEHRLIAARSTNSKIEFAFSYDANGNVTKTESYVSSSLGNKTESSKVNYTETTYTPDGGYVANSKNDLGNTTATNVYDTNTAGNIVKGNLIRSHDGNGNVTKYTYNADTDRIETVKAVDKTATDTVIAQNVYEYNTKNQLSGITAGINGSTVNYGFTYNTFGNQTAVGVGSQNLITNTYEANNGNLTGSAYGNGDTVSYTYDAYDRVTGVRYEGDTSDRYTYSYDSEGKLSRVVDNENGKTYTYVYDILGRLTSKSCSDGTRVSYAFDKYNKGTKTNYRINGINRSVSYTYNENKDNALDKTTFANSAQYQFVYNDYGQVTSANLTRDTLEWRNMYGYVDPGNNRYSNVISTLYFPDYEIDGRRLRYRYDTKGNIAQIADGNGSSTFENADKIVTYTYDQFNQLKTEVNGYTGETVNYTYDARGNILSKAVTKNGTTDTINYTYGDSNWKDKLTAYDGKTITYDQIGNPLTYDGWEYTWQKGRQLAGMSSTDTALSFTYNNDGIRTSKAVDGVTTEYYLDGSTILGQKTGTQTLLFHYDGNGTRVYMEVQNANGTTQGYYYVYNQQGDVIALYDNTGAVVAEYTYDSWGKVVSITGSNTAVGNLNPFRYRGYYYDSETQLYYLNSRYYNPEIGRFINADKSTILGICENHLNESNLFVYCFNNVVKLCDDSGEWPSWKSIAIAAAAVTVVAAVAIAAPFAAPVLIGAAIGCGISVGMNVGTQMATKGSVDIDEVIVSGSIGMISGAFGGSACGTVTQIGVNAALGAAEVGANDWIHGTKSSALDYGVSVAIGGAAGLAGGAGQQYISLPAEQIGKTITRSSMPIFSKQLKKSYLSREMLKGVPRELGFSFITATTAMIYEYHTGGYGT